jgi:DNA-binding LacI/PurR family transcriptional regulator
LKFPESIQVDTSSDIPINQQLKTQLGWTIASGQLKPGERLPSVRKLAGQLGINFQTIRLAYQRLESEGLVSTRQGFGTIVNTLDPIPLRFKPGRVRTHTIGVILPDIANPFYHAFVAGVEEIAAEKDMLVMLCCSHDDPGVALQSLRKLLAREVDGVILASCLVPGLSDRGDLDTGKQPFVFADLPGRSGTSVVMDLENAGYSATRHLLGHGYRRVGLITHEQDFENVLPLNAGYKRALTEAGVSPSEAWITRVAAFDEHSGRVGVEKLLRLAVPPEAVFCITDRIALGAIRELQSRGLQVPGDIAVVGFNDIPEAACCNPPLTTVAAPARELGAESFRRLFLLVNGSSLPEPGGLLPTRLIVRESCGEHSPNPHREDGRRIP